MTETSGIRRRLGLFAGISSIAIVACAADVPVGHTMSLKLGSGDRIVLDTTAVSNTLPAVGVEPILWVDASDTTGWEFDETTGRPKKIPSKVGSRYLKNYHEAGDSFAFPNSGYPSGATLVDDGLNGKAYLDFGAEGSKSGYMLNPILVSEGDTATTNWLGGIKTVIAVYGSQQGGGYFVFGGGFGSSAGGPVCAGNGWQRGVDNKKEDSSRRSSVQMFGTYSFSAFWGGVQGWFDGVAGEPRFVGFNGGWQVVSMVSTSTKDINAAGVGVNDVSYKAAVAGNQLTGGGMKIAEVVVYDQALTEAQRKSVEAYLQKKWFNRTLRGAGGRAYAGRVHLFSTDVAQAGVAAGAEVADGETLEVDEITGGRGKSCSFTKTGAGTLALGTSGNFHGTLNLAGGTLKMAPLDAAAEMPCTNAILVHLDTKGAKADNFETAVSNGVEYVTKWKNLASDRKSNGNAFYMEQTDAAHQPVLATWTGGYAVDFGRYKTDGSGRWMNFSTSKASYSNTALTTVGSTFVVLSSEFAGTLFGADNDNGVFSRASRGSISGFNHPDSPVWSKGWPTWLNGVGIDSKNEGQDTIGYHLLATQIPGVNVCGRIGAGNSVASSGGMKIAEMVVYDHMLTEDEFRQAESALMAKWFGRDRPGFATKYDIDRLQVDAESTLYVPAGMTLRVRSLVCNAILHKRGAGVLQVDATSNTAESGIQSKLRLHEGALRFVETEDVVVDASAPAGDMYLHLDPSVSDSIVTNDSGTVLHWNEVGTVYSNMLYTSAGTVSNLVDCFGPGLSAVDFGSAAANNNYSGAHAIFVRPLENIRTLYFVAANMSLGGYFLGLKLQKDDNWLDDRKLQESSRNGSKFLNTPDSYSMVTMAPMYRDGSTIDRNTVLDDGVHLYEIHATGNAYASAIARNALGHITGGIRLGEMIAYDRPLTEREKTATRNYLMKKWLGATELDPLPSKPEESTDVFLEEIDAADGVVYGDVKGGNLVGGGSVTKIGDGTMEIRDMTEFAGVLTVSNGTLKMTGVLPPVEPAMPESKPVMHLDASRIDTLTLEKDGSGVDRVTEWRSLTDNGWKAVPRSVPNHSEKPKYVSDEELGGRSTLRWGNNWPGMSFRDADNTVTQKIEKLYTALWIIGAQEGGGFLLGSGDTATGDWYHRGNINGSYGGSYLDPLMFGSGGARTAEFFVNDTRMSAHSTFPPKTEANQMNTGYPSAGWHFVSMRQGTTYVETEKTVSADGLAYCKTASYGRDGRQRLAEVVIYTNQLTAAECRAAGYHMRIKWGLITGMQRSQTNAAQVVVASGATLDLGGTNQYLKAIGGAGTVVNGDLAASQLVADLSGAALTVLGAFTATDPFTVEVRNAAGLPNGYYELLSAGSIVNAEAISAASLTGDGLPQGSKLRVRDGKVLVRLGNPGTVIIVE